MKTHEGTNATGGVNRLVRSGRFLIVAACFAVVALLAPRGAVDFAYAKPPHDTARPTIVLLHGDWADASSWNGVVERLQHKGYIVVAPPNPLRGPTSDSAYVSSFLQSISGPIVLVAHSYGGFVATNAAAGNPNVKALVYVDAFIPDEGQILLDLASDSCVAAPAATNPVPEPGGVVDLYLRAEPGPGYDGFSGCFANGVDPKQARVLQATQRPAAFNQFFEPSGPPAWKTIPSWSLIGTEDHVIPLAKQQAMSTNAGAHITTVDVGHLSLIIRPNDVVKMIDAAVDATS